MTPILAFDIETVPDIAGLRLLRDLDAKLSDRDVAEHAFQQRRAQTGQDFLPLHLHRVVAIACALREGKTFRCWSLGSPDDGEGELLRRFFDGVEKYTPQLVSWNGGGFDLPVLHYRGLVHGVSAPRYWDMGEDDRDFKFNNYISRYHQRHLDLMELRAAGRAGPAPGVPGQDRNGRIEGLGSVPIGKDRRYPEVLRNGRGQHLSRFPALPAAAWRLRRGALPARAGAGPGHARPFQRGPLARVRRPVELKAAVPDADRAHRVP